MGGTKKIVGLAGLATQETANRVLSGMLRYVRTNPQFQICDVRMPPQVSTGPVAPPHWQGKVDGVIVSVGRLPGTNDRQTADWLLSGDARLVQVARDWSDPRIPCVALDQNKLGALAAEHLLNVDCQSFLYVGFTNARSGSNLRARAFARPLARRGHKVERADMATPLFGGVGDVKRLRKERHVMECLRRMKKPLGVWAVNDDYACGVAALCRALKLRVPAEVRIVGVDDLVASRINSPSLTTIHTSSEEVGFQAMQLLHQLLDGQPVPSLTELPPGELVRRASTGYRYAADPRLQETLTYIARHACQELPVPHLAERIDMSRRSFELKFRALVGRSPHEEIERVRLERAKEFLLCTELSVGSISDAVGFQDVSHFCKFFRHKAGLSPGEYRRTLLGAVPGPARKRTLPAQTSEP